MLRYTNVYNHSDVELTLSNYFSVSHMLQAILCVMWYEYPLPSYTGPKVEEVSIFWQMVMEHKPAVVVMLTNVEENGKVWMVFMSLQLTNIHKMQPFCVFIVCHDLGFTYVHPHISLLMCAICSHLKFSYLCIFCIHLFACGVCVIAAQMWAVLE